MYLDGYLINYYFPVIVRLKPVFTLIADAENNFVLLQNAIEETTGVLGVPPFITTSVLASGTLPQLQLAGSSQRLLLAPIQ